MIKKILKSYDYSLILAIFLLCSIGLVMVYSSSMITAVARYDAPSDFFFKKQLLALLGGTVLFLCMMAFPYRAYLNNTFLKIVFFGSFAVLFALFVFGSVAGGARSWFKLFGMSIQPGEFAKLCVIFYLAAIFEKKQPYIHNFGKAVLPPLAYAIGICLCVVIQPDLGTAIIIALIVIAMVACSGIGTKNIMRILILIGLCIAITLPFILMNSSHIFTKERVSRFTGFADPFKNEKGDGYQLVNSLYAIGSGGVTGLGLGNSVQKYGYLPESHTDFIMAVVSEELGAPGVIGILALLAFIILKGFLIARKCQDPFGTLLAAGISSMLGIQALVNLGGMTGLIPITGVTLPFISYGGSSMILLMIAMGVLVNISMFANYKKKYASNETTPDNVKNMPIPKQKPLSN
ncbi:FtsW/RodA/SpoVE family cell cycle protein [Metabacillus sp. RGM 3146]|uniref:FtsW/RodA/SpoVE family cell cycle protein n=1 Tax=Metabacillus sp. RGM 3146 TaxID=3401092 RepID=UPI003B9D77E3